MFIEVCNFFITSCFICENEKNSNGNEEWKGVLPISLSVKPAVTNNKLLEDSQNTNQ